MSEPVRETVYRPAPGTPGTTTTVVQKREGGLGRTLGIILLVAVALFAIAWATGFINFDTSGSLRAPDVKVEGGELPAVQMETADVNVGTKETTIEVPTVDVDKPADDGSAKR